MLSRKLLVSLSAILILMVGVSFASTYAVATQGSNVQFSPMCGVNCLSIYAINTYCSAINTFSGTVANDGRDPTSDSGYLYVIFLKPTSDGQMAEIRSVSAASLPSPVAIASGSGSSLPSGAVVVAAIMNETINPYLGHGGIMGVMILKFPNLNVLNSGKSGNYPVVRTVEAALWSINTGWATIKIPSAEDFAYILV